MSYRQLKIQKKFRKGGKLKRYKNLAAFNKECAKSTRSRVHGESMLCMLKNERKLKDGSGMATVDVRAMTNQGSRKSGTWLLHFASYDVMKRHIKGRV